MIKALWIDETWLDIKSAAALCEALEPSSIVLANDRVANDEIYSLNLKAAVPPHIKMAIKEVDCAVELIKDTQCEQMNLLVLVYSPEDALSILKAVDDIPHVIVGSYGQRQGSGSQARVELAPAFSVTGLELEQFLEITQLKSSSVYQPSASHQAIPLCDLLYDPGLE